jgi:N-acetyl-anhydromuramyl-L-alanine amidase AmpD
MQIVKQPLSLDQYDQAIFPKKQVYLHHTAGNSDPFATIKDWQTDERGKIATAYVIGGWGNNDGVVVEAFDPKYWAWHLGITTQIFTEHKIPYQALDKISIGIEVCNWGQLTENGGKYFNYVNREVPKEQVCVLDKAHRGYRYYHKYTPKQIQSLHDLLIQLKTQFSLWIQYNDDIWALNTRALSGTPGMYTHNSVRPDKVDMSPQPDLIAMLKTL